MKEENDGFARSDRTSLGTGQGETRNESVDALVPPCDCCVGTISYNKAWPLSRTTAVVKGDGASRSSAWYLPVFYL